MGGAVSHGHEIRRQSFHEGRQYLTCKRAYKGRGKNIGVVTSWKSGSIKCMCPFALWGKEGRDGLWRLTIKNGNHNHNPHKYSQGIRSLNRLTQEQREVTKLLKNSHVKPKEILHHLRQTNPNTSAALRDVYNESAKTRREKMKGKIVVQHLWHKLSESGYSKWHRTNSAGDTVQDVMFAHPHSINLLQLFPYVILMDCTYKTKRYEMPFLEIIGITPVGRNFTIAVAFMSREDEDTYAWTLRCLRDILPSEAEPEVILTDRELGLLKALPNVFPQSNHMLCLYHINRNVEANATKFLGNKNHGVFFRRTVWEKLVNSETEEEYGFNYSEMVSLYGEYPKLITYVNHTWLIYKERFVKYWTNNILHFGNTTTNRVKSAHRASKSWLQTWTGAIDTVQNQLDAQVHLQVNELKVKNERSRTVRMYGTSYPCFGALICNVSHNALDLLDEELEKLQQNPDRCNCYLSRTHGLPCACQIAVKIAEGDTYYPQQIHPFWRTLTVEPMTIPYQDEEPFDRAIAIQKALFDEFKKLSKMDYMSQKYAANYLRDINNPASTHLEEPSFVNAKRRPKNNAMKHDLSGYEHIMNRKIDVKSSPGSRGRKIPTKEPTEGTPGSKLKGRGRGRTKSTEEAVVTAGDWVDFFSFLPSFLAQSIASYVNVRADGNCGYRCIAKIIYGSQERWPQVRTDLVAEFMERHHLYADMFGGDEEGRNVVVDHILTCSHESGPAPQTKWMSTDMGLAIATRYNAMVIIFTEFGSFTYLPLVGNPALSNIIPMSLHNYHFMILRVPVYCPLPRLHPQWRYYAAPNLLALQDFYADRLALWTTLNDAKESIQACVSEFNNFITVEANNICHRDYRRTVTPEDVLAAMALLGFGDYIEPLIVFLNKHRAHQDLERGSMNQLAQFVRRDDDNAYMSCSCGRGEGSSDSREFDLFHKF
ncbi:PREDICTED: uncharacterized protein LOC105954483 [Erythranthe guttata]|uniref:uncharacterized protein LOC105954483 n=1 Tax=Erythranthe guttata TaxID=4155 RepID=UPI00064DA97B|nr:PREDICTED: uncharacterized protein LOC105954483 [Erythranthe guttata]|eukprot:XP_012833608.1 PREDICTED: uncharacterized protein LOC105954483 [Erythranthe guttata]